MSMNFGKVALPVSFNPQTAFPLDSRSYFESLTDAQSAAASAKEAGSDSSIYYYGELITVFENDSIQLYIINKNGDTGELKSISDYVGNYLPLSGGTLTGALKIQNGSSFTLGTRPSGNVVGKYSFSSGVGLTASGENSAAFGSSNAAKGYSSIAEGRYTETGASAGYAHSSGNYTRANGGYSWAGGSYARAKDIFSYVWQGGTGGDVPLAYYESHGAGTYNINPIGGIDGFYIGSDTIRTIIDNRIREAISNGIVVDGIKYQLVVEKSSDASIEDQMIALSLVATKLKDKRSGVDIEIPDPNNTTIDQLVNSINSFINEVNELIDDPIIKLNNNASLDEVMSKISELSVAVDSIPEEGS